MSTLILLAKLIPTVAIIHNFFKNSIKKVFISVQAQVLENASLTETNLHFLLHLPSLKTHRRCHLIQFPVQR